MKIGEKTLERGGEMLTALMKTYQKRINEAFVNEGEKSLKIGLSLDIEPGPASGTFRLQAGISFISQRVKDTYTDNVDEQQLGLFDEEKAVGGPGFRDCPVQGMPVYADYCERTCPLYVEILQPDGETYPVRTLAVHPFDGSFIQERPCSAWANDFTRDNILAMLARLDAEAALAPPLETEEPPVAGVDPPIPGPVTSILHTYRIQHQGTKEWWQGEAASAADACILAGWNAENCEIKVGSPGAWRKCRESDLDDPIPCVGCANHRRRGNPKHGVTIPGVHGKCIRDGGICDVMIERIGEAA